jgi:WD40 repeat protein
LLCSRVADGNKLAVTESNGNVMVWNAIAGCQWYQIPQAHKGKVTACAWSFDCRRFVTAGTDSIMAVSQCLALPS